jgi:hypothetical protein
MSAQGAVLLKDTNNVVFSPGGFVVFMRIANGSIEHQLHNLLLEILWKDRTGEHGQQTFCHSGNNAIIYT